MSLEEISVQGFRNLGSTQLSLDTGINLIVGANGAGKTSLLEAVYFLGRVRSFRVRDLSRLVAHGESACVVSGRVRDGEGRAHRLGVTREPGGVRARVDGSDVGLLSELAPLLPVDVINSESQGLLTGGPAERRRLLGWGVFHVEPDYRGERRAFDRALLQRNAALRQGDLRLARSWEPELALRGELVDAAHRRYLERLWPRWSGTFGHWLPQLNLGWRYRSGWRQGEALAASLERGREGDLAQGHTGAGPQRADLLVMAGDRLAAEVLSRGQQKLVILALRLAQVELAASLGRRPVLLLDDLGAELDWEKRCGVLETLGAQEVQLLMTAVEEREVPDGPIHRRFHVEQGRYHRVI